MLTLHLQADTLTELRAQAILALDIRTLSHEQAAAKVTELQYEVTVSDTPTAEILEKPEESQVQTTEALSKETSEPVVSDAAEPEPVPEKPAKKTRAKKEKPAIIAAFAEAIEKQADEAIELLAPEPEKLTVESARSAFQQYVQKFGLEAAKEDGPILLERVYGSGSVLRVKDIPEKDQAKLGRIIAAVEGAILTNEFKRPAVQ